MKSTSSIKFVLIFLAPLTASFAQSTATPKDQFTLTLRQGLRDGRFPKGTVRLIVRLTNMSDAWIREDSCEAGGAFNKLIVFYNRQPVTEPKWIHQRREAAEAEEGKGRLCNDSNPGRHISLGQYWEDYLNYVAAASGIYQFTVELKLPQIGSVDSPPVRSNTLIVVIPPEESGTP